MPSRRTVLQSLAATVPLAQSTTGILDNSDDRGGPNAPGRPEAATSDPVTLRVHVHRVETIPAETFERVVRTIDVGIEQVERAADRELDRVVERDVLEGGTADAREISTASRDAVHASTTEWLRGDDRFASNALHLVLVDAPFSQSIGYGQNASALGDTPGLGYANVGATEQWETDVVTENIALHEVLHGLLAARDVERVLGRRCEHDLGAVHPAPRRGAVVTPMATAYASTVIGTETQWPGSGCRDRLSADVSYDPHWWGHTYQLSVATRAATTQFVARLHA